MNSWRDSLDSWITWGILAILVAAPTQYGVAVLGKVNLSLVDPLIALTAAAAVLREFRSGNWRQSWRLFPLAIGLILLLSAISLLYAGNRRDAVKDLLQYVEYFAVAYWLFARGLGDDALRRRAVTAFLAVATAVIAIATLQYWMPGVAGFDVRGTFGNRNVYGGFLALVLPLMFGVLLHEPRWGRRIWLTLAVFAGFASVLAGGTLLALGFAFAVIATFKSGRTFWVMAGLLLLLGTAAAWLPRDNLNTAIETVAPFNADGAPARRYTEWQAATAMAQDNPWFGVGIGNYQENVGRYFGTLPAVAVKAEADSQCLHLVLASSLGIPALLCFLGLLLSHARSAVKAFFRSTDPARQGLALGALGSIIAFNVNSLFAPLLVRGIGVILVFVLALAAAVAAAEDAPGGAGRG